jgi:hypothetical protein
VHVPALGRGRGEDRLEEKPVEQFRTRRRRSTSSSAETVSDEIARLRAG